MSQDRLPQNSDKPSLREVIDAAKLAGLRHVESHNSSDTNNFITDNEGSSIDDKVSRNGANTYVTVHTKSTITNPTEVGTVSYEAEHSLGDMTRYTPQGKPQYSSMGDSKSTEIVRKDEQGKEVYRFSSTNPEMADKVGALAARRIIKSAEEKMDRADAA